MSTNGRIWIDPERCLKDGEAEVPLASFGPNSGLGSMDQTDACVGWIGAYPFLLSWSCM